MVFQADLAQGWSLVNAGDYNADLSGDLLIFNNTTGIVGSVLLQNNSVLSVNGIIDLSLAPGFTILSGKP